MPDFDWAHDLGQGVAELGAWSGDHAARIAVPLIGAGALWNWVASRDERLRNGYAESIRALVAWQEFPYRILRRTSNDPATLERLAEIGHKIQEDLAYWTTWIASDNQRVAEAYGDAVDALRSHLIEPIRTAWNSPPSDTPEAQAQAAGLGIQRKRCDALIEVLQQLAHSRRAPHRWNMLSRRPKQLREAVKEKTTSLGLPAEDNGYGAGT